MGGLWVIFGHYLTVRLWSSDFSIADDNLEKQVVWVRLPGLSEGFYSEFLLLAIGQVIGPMVKIDAHTNATAGGRFARMAVCMDINKRLVSHVRINGRLQRVEYESLPNVCFTCGLYGHNLSFCLGRQAAGAKPTVGQNESEG